MWTLEIKDFKRHIQCLFLYSNESQIGNVDFIGKNWYNIYYCNI